MRDKKENEAHETYEADKARTIREAKKKLKSMSKKELINIIVNLSSEVDRLKQKHGDK